MSEDKFFDSVMIQDAVVRRLKIIGEAAKNLPISFGNKHLNPKLLYKFVKNLTKVVFMKTLRIKTS